jgi:hypothetical protein
MKKLFIAILLLALVPFAAGAQDARQRTAETIVADALAQLPAQTPKAFDSLMQELAATGADGIRMMAGMLVPASEGKNAVVEYALGGVVSYVSAQGREALARSAPDWPTPSPPRRTNPTRPSCSRCSSCVQRPRRLPSS